eukprot:NODE_2944_length_723_cov_16.916914_g2079_i0.p1 GENE.NODE_2944_length_723_cov_16.916914_g2079_i0~~NODE_2944_length_723_cov_16.916914_g2079_i0.p1  ORF type:complete len:100 (-),score=2.48 NODE_2944_length_723_cov_16.916914_g2079_i0:279-578(-)
MQTNTPTYSPAFVHTFIARKIYSTTISPTHYSIRPYMHAGRHAYIIHRKIPACMHPYQYIHTGMHVGPYSHVYMHVCICIYIYVFTYICMCVRKCMLDV